MTYTKKTELQKLLTIYGRKPVLEALSNPHLNCYKLHLSSSNRPANIIQQCIKQAESRDITIAYHDKRSLSFISKNSKQDQGIALDIRLTNLLTLEELREKPSQHLLLLDNVTNPQNVGMIIRTVAAGFIGAIIVPEKGCADLGPLSIKASAGAIFKAQMMRVSTTDEALRTFKDTHRITGLSLNTDKSLYELDMSAPRLFIVGNESEGISQNALNSCNDLVKIPMNNDVESLNVATTAALIAFHPSLVRSP